MRAQELRGIEDKIDYLIEQVRRWHEQTNSHEWVKDYRPWDKGNEYHVFCLCGEQRPVAKSVYDTAETKYDGY